MRDESQVPAAKQKMLGAAGSFTGLWALTWLGAQAFNPSTAIQGGFAVGGVMASSGLTALWWKTRMIVALEDESETQEAEAEEQAEAVTQGS